MLLFLTDHCCVGEICCPIDEMAWFLKAIKADRWENLTRYWVTKLQNGEGHMPQSFQSNWNIITPLYFVVYLRNNAVDAFSSLVIHMFSDVFATSMTGSDTYRIVY